MSTSPSGLLLSSGAGSTVAPVMMEDSSAMTRLKWSPKSSAISIASKCYLGRDDSVRLSFLARDLLAIAAISVSNSTMALTTITVSAISGISLSITTLLLNGSSPQCRNSVSEFYDTPLDPFFHRAKHLTTVFQGHRAHPNQP